MHEDQDAMVMVRAELCERLASLRSFSQKLSPQDLASSIRPIRTMAAAYGLMPVVRLADALERAMAENVASRNAACSTALYLDRLQDAIGCTRVDEQASEAMIASISVRLSA